MPLNIDEPIARRRPLLPPALNPPPAQPDAVANLQVRDTVLLHQPEIAIVHAHRKLVPRAVHTLLPLPATDRAGVRIAFARSATERDIDDEPDRRFRIYT